MINKYQNYKYLLINSKDRSYGNNSDFMVNIPFSIPIKTIHLLNAQIPNTFFNITSNNNTILLNNISVSVPPGSYNWTQFQEQFLVTLGFSFESVTYDTINQVVIMTLKTGSPPFNVSFPQNNSIHSVIGFEQSYNVTAFSFTGSYCPSLQENFIFLEVGEFGNNQLVTNNLYRGQTFAIPNTVNQGDYILYNSNTNYDQYINCFNNDKQIFNLTIKMKDYFGKTLQNLGSWSCLLCLYY